MLGAVFLPEFVISACLPGAAAPGLEDFNETLLYSSEIVQP